MIRQVLLVTVAAAGLAGCSFPQTKMEPLESQLQPAPAAEAASGKAETRQSKTQPASGQPSG